MHKAQGLTLRRATYDAGPSEPKTHVGITLVALTRVRHPGHIALAPFACSVERLTTEIATKPSLFQRKLHEWHLRRHARCTAARLQHLNPPASALASLPPKPVRQIAKTPSTPQVAGGKRKTVSLDELWTSRPQQIARRDEVRTGTAGGGGAYTVAASELSLGDSPSADDGPVNAQVDDDVLMDEEIMYMEGLVHAADDEELACEGDDEAMADEMFGDLFNMDDE